MKMDGAIPVEVARFRTKERLVHREVCGATKERLPTGRRFFVNCWSAFFPEGSALCGLPAENSGELVEPVLDSVALGSPSRAESPEISV